MLICNPDKSSALVRMGSWWSSTDEELEREELQRYGLRLLEAYTICCGHCCAVPTVERPIEKWIKCTCSEHLYYCSRRCKHEDAEIHCFTHRVRGEVIAIIAKPDGSQKVGWTRVRHASVIGITMLNPRTGAMRLSIDNNCVRVISNRDKLKLLKINVDFILS